MHTLKVCPALSRGGQSPRLDLWYTFGKRESTFSMTRKLLAGAAAIYFLGVLGVSVGYLSSHWAEDWPLGDQIVESLRVGIFWPAYAAEMLIGA